MIGEMAFEIIFIAITVFVTFCVGLIVGHARTKSNLKPYPRKCGDVVINTTDPEKDTIRFELEVPITEMMEQDEISFVVRKES